MYLLENYGSAEKMARMNSASYEKLRSLSRGNFLPQQFLKLKELAANTVGVNNSIIHVAKKLIRDIQNHYMTIIHNSLFARASNKDYFGL